MTLKRGVSQDPQFGAWTLPQGNETGTLRPQSIDLLLEILNEGGARVRGFEFRGCRMIKFTPSVERNDTTKAGPIESITLAYEALRPVD
jgi:hypothetical protein